MHSSIEEPRVSIRLLRCHISGGGSGLHNIQENVPRPTSQRNKRLPQGLSSQRRITTQHTLENTVSFDLYSGLSSREMESRLRMRIEVGIHCLYFK